MPKKIKQYADDGWAVWIDGDDTSTVYLNYWFNPKGESFVDVSIKILGIQKTKGLNIFVPFLVEKEEIEDVSLKFNDERIVRATFSAGCVIDYKKDKYTSEIAYNGKTIDVIHVSESGLEVERLESGTLIKINFESIMPYVNNEEGYFSFRLPHKSLNEVFSTYSTVGSSLKRIRDMLTTPILSEKYGYSVRINEARLLPPEINKRGGFHRQKLRKAVITVSIREDYEIGDTNCYHIRRLEEHLYKNFVPKGFKCDNVITYQWKETRKENLRGYFNFYFNVTRNVISKASLFIYMTLLVFFGALGNALWDLIKFIIGIY